MTLGNHPKERENRQVWAPFWNGSSERTKAGKWPGRYPQRAHCHALTEGVRSHKAAWVPRAKYHCDGLQGWCRPQTLRYCHHKPIWVVPHGEIHEYLDQQGHHHFTCQGPKASYKYHLFIKTIISS